MNNALTDLRKYCSGATERPSASYYKRGRLLPLLPVTQPGLGTFGKSIDFCFRSGVLSRYSCRAEFSRACFVLAYSLKSSLRAARQLTARVRISTTSRAYQIARGDERLTRFMMRSFADVLTTIPSDIDERRTGGPQTMEVDVI